MPSSPSYFCSVLMVTYNHEDYIYEAIKSIFFQSYTEPFELIITDDCSTDATGKEIKKALEEVPSHIEVRYTRNDENIGGVANFNKSIELCRGEYVLLADGDDVSYPMRLEKLIEHHSAKNKSLYVTNADHINSEGDATGELHYYQELSLARLALKDIYTGKVPIFGASYFFERSLFDKYGSIDLSLVTHNNVDQNIFWRAWLQKGVDYFHEPLILYRVHDSGASLRNKDCPKVISLNGLNKVANLVYVEQMLNDDQRSEILPALRNAFDELHTHLSAAHDTGGQDHSALDVGVMSPNSLSINGVEYGASLKSLKKLHVAKFIKVISKLSQTKPLPNEAISFLVSELKKKKLNKNEIAALMLLRAKRAHIPHLTGFWSHVFLQVVLIARIFKLTKLHRSLDPNT